MGLLTAPTYRIFLSVARSFVHCMDGWIIHGFLIIVHGQHPWTTSLSSIHGQRPRTTLLSSKGDLISYKPHSRSRTSLSLVGWFLIPSALLDFDDPYGRIGDELISRYPIRSNNIIIKSSERLRYFFFSFYSWNCFESIPFFLNFSFFSYFLDWISLFNSHSILFI